MTHLLAQWEWKKLQLYFCTSFVIKSVCWGDHGGISSFMTRTTGNASWDPLHSHPNKGIWISPSRHLELNLWIQEMSSKQHGTIKHRESSKESGTNQCLELKISFVMHAHDYKLTLERITSISIRTKKLEKTHLSLVGSLRIISDINFYNILISQSSLLPFPDQGCIPLTAAQLHENSFVAA